MPRSLASVLSYLFHPLWLATWLFALLVARAPLLTLPPGYSASGRWLVVLAVWLSTFLIPALSLLMLRVGGLLTSLQMSDRRERQQPFFLVAILYTFTAWFFARQLAVAGTARVVLTHTAGLVWLAALINLYWKISIHSLGAGGMAGTLMAVSVAMPELGLLPWALTALVLAGGVMSARLRLQAHTPAQVYAGFALGFLVGFLLVLWL